PAHPPGPSARMQVVAAAVRAHLNQNYPSYDDLWVRDSVCDRSETVGPGPVPCADLTEQEKTDLERLLQAYTIKWVGSVREIWSPTGQLNRPFVKISELEAVSTDGGSVFVYALRGGRDCAGVSYQVRLLPDGPPTVSPGDQFLIC
ncbi:MAG: hypothetical protein M3386_06435, partial [Actinomycetota bacterium]|nr:hypothetical protein [Actinomycetota bacterium]